MVNGDFAKLTRKHGIKISAGFACTVEEIGLAVGEKVGHGSIKSLARMNSAVVIFLDQVEKVNCVIETGITVSEEANSQLDGPLTIQELQTALQGMQGRRAPGIDGLSVEFYRAYWDVLSNDL
ncbi:hypothetical protein NHX12_024803 [Muraenolepis orangiensis]|uniref:Uncharacterized protein n=1 Tax=Muraenolepis orangiensis TaxID=630683 RepID=A0A9Q0IP32_9TELE|nr:hypothetical protein NHX12_024803 [Muraenolepis orangiensis]